MRWVAPAALGLLLPVLMVTALLSRPVHLLNGGAHYAGTAALQPAMPAGTIVDQVIVPRHDDWSALGLVFSTSAGRSHTHLRLSVLDADGTVQRSTELSAQRLNDTQYTDVEFAPLPGSRGRAFHIRLEVIETNSRRAFSVLATDEGALAERLTVNGVVRPNHLVVRTFYGPTEPAVRALPLLLARASQYKPPALKIPWLTLWMVATGLATGAAVISLARLLALDHEGRAG